MRGLFGRGRGLLWGARFFALGLEGRGGSPSDELFVSLEGRGEIVVQIQSEGHHVLVVQFLDELVKSGRHPLQSLDQLDQEGVLFVVVLGV